MTLADEIKLIIEPLIKDSSIHLYDIKLSKESVDIFVDKPNGISLDECVKLHREFFQKISEEHKLADYNISFSTPGINRKCVFPVDFLFYKDRLYSFKLKDNSSLVGKVNIIDESSGELEIISETITRLKWSEIKEASFASVN